ncbi:MAG TPA: hypothetical protein PLR76_05920 [Hyphomonas sp.]|nr:hypothetical protein [Hyphomonas sp.]MCA8904424.1 hypothetical protein [Hyphomonas sp.]MCB9962577.1 hypothetical protein [Hyphomonas sp.]MCB9971971.1 hypothetical protein [Hyphomonas sp.]HPE47910.1 hypothetical protein [Hyphomonas sp.]
MRRFLTATILLAAPLLAACVSSNSAEGREAEAYAKCSYSPGPKEREACIKTELALIEARDRKEAEAAKADQEAAERRQAELEAAGVPRDDAAQTTDSGLHWPR